MSESQQRITWFANSPDAGDPTCICSWCYRAIGEQEAPILRLFNTEANTEARFHRRCLVESGVLPGITFPEAAFYPEQGFDDAEGRWEPATPHEGD